MMSYLWILLLGSLLATSAKAQDDGTPEEVEVTPIPVAPEGDAASDETVVDVEETEHTDEDIPPANSDAEPTHEPEAGDVSEAPADVPVEVEVPAIENEETEVPAEEDTEALPAGDDTEAAPSEGDDTDAATPVSDDTEAATPAGGDAEPTPAGGDAEEVIPTEVDVEVEPAAATPEPAADPEVVNPEVEQPTVHGEEETTSSNDAAPAQEEDGVDVQVTPAPEAVEEDNKEEPTDPAVDTGVTDGKVEEIVPVDVVVPSGTEFNLEDALSDDTGDNNQAHRGQSRSIGSGAQAAGATGEADEPGAKEGGSGSLAGILSAIVVSAVGAVTGYFAYQKKKLCFKNRQEADPEAARKADAAEAQSDPQVLSNLLKSS